MKRITLAVFVCLAGAPAVAADIAGRATVIDGDTIAVERERTRVRLSGIDAPEKGQRCQDEDGDAYLCGSRSADALAAIIGRNGRVRCEVEDRDRYGRAVATCRRGELDIGGELVRQGWARDYVRYSRGRYADEEAEAKAARRGAWSGTWQAPWEWRRDRRSKSR